jgi:LysM repeat protein
MITFEKISSSPLVKNILRRDVKTIMKIKGLSPLSTARIGTLLTITEKIAIPKRSAKEYTSLATKMDTIKKSTKRSLVLGSIL